MPKILYPPFLELSLEETDKFWKNIFEDIAFGIFPSGTYIDNGLYISKMKHAEFRIPYNNLPKDELLKKVKTLLQTKLNIHSSSELINKQKYISNRLGEQPILTWNEIRKKNIKDILIENYVIEMSNKYKLTPVQSRKLLSLITIGLQFKFLTPKDIHFDTKIQTINGIEYRDGEFYFNHLIDRITEQDVVLDNMVCLRDLWMKYNNTIE
jgi:hypothetical protein